MKRQRKKIDSWRFDDDRDYLSLFIANDYKKLE